MGFGGVAAAEKDVVVGVSGVKVSRVSDVSA